MPSILATVDADDVMPVPLAPVAADFRMPPEAVAAAAAGIATPFTVDFERGVAWGHVAPWDRCLLDGSGQCWTPPQDDDLSLSMQGVTELADGTRIACGVIPMDMNHASIRLTGDEAIDVMANTSVQFARVVYGKDQVGIWAAGPIVPGVTYGQAVRVAAAAQSGDWRAVFHRIIDESGRFRFTGSIAVNIGGLPLDRAAAVAANPGLLARAASAGPGAFVASMVGGRLELGWAHTAAGTRTKEAEQFLAESKALTEKVKADRERIYAKYESLLRGVSGVKTERGKSVRTERRAEVRKQRSAELQSLREKTKADRATLAAKRKTAIEELRKRQRSEREAFTDKVRGERKTLTEGGADAQGQIMEGFRSKSKALSKRFASIRDQIAAEFRDRSEQIADLDPDARPEARRALADARKSKMGELRDRFTAERERLQAEKSAALEKFRVQKRKERADLSDRQRAEREKAKTGAMSMGDDGTFEYVAGQAVVLLDGSMARVASTGTWLGEDVIVTDAGDVVSLDEIDTDAKVAASLYRLTTGPQLPHHAEVTYRGGTGLVCSFGKSPEGVALVTVRSILPDGTVAPYGEEVTLPLADCVATGRVAEYVGYEDSEGRSDFDSPDRIVDSGPAASPSAAVRVASADCGCGGAKTAAESVPGNVVPPVEDPTAQIAMDEVEALKARIAELEAKIDVLARSNQEKELADLEGKMAALASHRVDL